MAIDINIGSKLDAKGFKQADTALNKLNKSSKNVARNLGLAFGTAAVLAYGRASVKAFVEDDKAATSLAQTLKNLDLAYGSNIGTVNGYISRLEMQTGVLDDELRPAMDRLLRATGSVTKSQELLNLALDVAAGTGKSVTQVSQSLQKAFLGQNQALGRLGVGLSKAELESKSFEEIQLRLSTLFAGQASAAADTYAGSLAKLTIAGNNAKETIGKGLVDALKTATGSSTIDPTVDGINKVANAIAGLIKETGKFIAITKANFDLKNLSFFAKDPFAFKGMGNVSVSRSSQDTQRADRLAATKAAAEQVKATKALTKSTKDQLKLAKAKAIFDIQKIQIEAALKGKISEEERIRLLLLKAIAEENMDDIEKYTKMLNAVQGKVEALQETLAEVYAMDAGNPFISWEIGLDGVERAIIEINKQSIELTDTIAQNSLAMGLLGGASFAQALSGARYAAQAAASMGISGTISGLPTMTPSPTNPTTTVNVVVQGTLTTQAELQQSIIDAVNQSGLTGNQLITAQPDRLVAI